MLSIGALYKYDLTDFTSRELTGFVREYVRNNRITGYSKLGKDATVSLVNQRLGRKDHRHNELKSKDDLLKEIKDHNEKYKIKFSGRKKEDLISIIKELNLRIDVVPERIMGKPAEIQRMMDVRRANHPRLTDAELKEMVILDIVHQTWGLADDSFYRYDALKQLNDSRAFQAEQKRLKEYPYYAFYKNMRTVVGRHSYVEYIIASVLYNDPEEYKMILDGMPLTPYMRARYENAIKALHDNEPENFTERIPYSIYKHRIAYGSFHRGIRIFVSEFNYFHNEDFDFEDHLKKLKNNEIVYDEE